MQVASGPALKQPSGEVVLPREAWRRDVIGHVASAQAVEGFRYERFDEGHFPAPTYTTPA